MALSETAKLAIRIEAQNMTDRAFSGLNARLDKLKSSALALGGALAGGLAFKNVLDSTRQWSRELDTLMDTIGLTADEAAQLNYVGRSVGVTTDEMAQSFGVLSKKLSDQAEAIAQGVSDFDKWGIGVRDASGNMASFDQILANTRTRLQQLGPGMAARAAEMDLFGKAGGRLHDMLMLTGEQVTQLQEEMRALGLGSTDQAVGAMEQFERNMARAGMAADALKIALGNALVPAIDEALRAFIGWVKEAMPTIRDVVIPMVREFLNLARAILDFARAVARAVGAIASAAFGVRRMDGFVKSLAETLRRVTGFVKSLTVEFEKFADMVGQKGIFGALLDLAGGIKDKVLEALGQLGEKLDSMGPAGTIAKAALLALGGAVVLNAIASAVTAISNVATALLRLPAKTILLIDVVLVGVAFDEIVKNVQLIADNWEPLRKAVNEGSLENKGAVEDFLITLVKWGDIFDALGTTTRTRLNEWGEIFRQFGLTVAITFTAIELVVKSIWRDLLVTFQNAVNSMIDAINPFWTKLGNPPIPRINIELPNINEVAQRLADLVRDRATTVYINTVETLEHRGLTRGVPGLAHGGIVLPRPGGTLIRAGEGGGAEAIVPLPSRGGLGGGVTVVNNIAGSVISERGLERFIREALVRDLRLSRQLAI